jgi:Outer membrane protein beta-barrel domain
MRRTAVTTIVGLSLVGAAMTETARADSNPLGLYVGASVGKSSPDANAIDPYLARSINFDDKTFGWGLRFGLKPIPFLGAEIAYMDFGTVKVGAGPQYDYGGGTSQFLGASLRSYAAALFAVGYLPLPIPWLRPFAKVGMAHLWTHYNSANMYGGESTAVPPFPVGQVSFEQQESSNDLAYGGGLQFPLGHLAVNMEYERLSVKSSSSEQTEASPALLSVGATWTF